MLSEMSFLTDRLELALATTLAWRGSTKMRRLPTSATAAASLCWKHRQNAQCQVSICFPRVLLSLSVWVCCRIVCACMMAEQSVADLALHRLLPLLACLVSLALVLSVHLPLASCLSLLFVTASCLYSPCLLHLRLLHHHHPTTNPAARSQLQNEHTFCWSSFISACKEL